MTTEFDELFAAKEATVPTKDKSPIPNQVKSSNTSWKIIIADDEKDVHEVTKMALAGIEFFGKTVQLLSSFSARETVDLLRQNPDTAVILLDVVMEEDDAGLKAVKQIREELENRQVRIVLRTGQPGKAPEKDVILNYDINNYLAKSEITAQKLFTTVIASLRAYSNLEEVSREVYHTIVDSAKVGIMIIDAKSKNIVDVNPAGKAVMGLPKEQIVYHSCRDFFFCDINGGQCLCHPSDEVLDHREQILLGKSGQKIPIFLSSVPITLHGQQYFVDTFLNITELKKLQEQLRILAYYDPMTKLANRALFMETLQQKLKNAARYEEKVGLLFIDLNKFKQVNDQHGHHIGDMLLTEVGKRLLSCLRESDLAARLGGDEFAVILGRTTGRDEAALVAQRIINDLEQPIKIECVTCEIGASIGISIFPVDASELETLLMKADSAMYQAKSTGESCYRFI